MSTPDTTAFKPATNPRRIVERPTSEDLARARVIIHNYLSPTPMIPSPALGMTVSLKLDSLQPTGSFKVRGAIAACAALPTGSWIVAASAGNHALGTAWASAQLGVPATVVVAETASSAKREALALLPIELIIHGQDFDTAEAFALTLAADPDRHATYVSPYNDPQVIAGQSTLLDELLAQLPGDRNRPLTVVAGVGGGGLVSGLSMRAHELSTDERPIRIIGVEAAESLAVSVAVEAGDTLEVPIGDTIADGLSGNLEPGSITVGMIAEYTDRLVNVSEAQLHDAIRWLAKHHGIIAEGAGAAATAAILADMIELNGSDVVAVISGRNIALPKLAAILTEQDA